MRPFAGVGKANLTSGVPSVCRTLFLPDPHRRLDRTSFPHYMAEMDTDRSVNTVALPPRTRRPDDRAREITQAALGLFVTRGFAATKLDDVARAAGVSKGLPYVYFKSKEEL